MRNDNDNFSDYFLIVLFYKNLLLFFNDFSGQFNCFDCFDSNVNNNFNCYSNDNNNNIRIDFQFMYSSFVNGKLTIYFFYLIIGGFFYITSFSFF